MRTPTPRVVPTRPRAQVTLVPQQATETPTPAPTPTTPPAPTATATPRPRPTAHPGYRAPVVTSASLSPASVGPGATLRANVTVSGGASDAEMYIGSPPGGPPPQTISLSETSPGVWSGSASAPSLPGTYHFTVGVYDFSGKRTVADNNNWNIQVTGPVNPTVAPAQAQPVPDNVPLAPPFSYGNPIPAVFSAEGQSVNGSEVVSNTRSDVPAGVVASYYEVHFPRAGWAVDQSSVPPAGASQFTIVATSGNQVCVVGFSGGTVHVFYGSL